MSYYELMVIFSSTLTEDEEKTQTSQVEDLIKHENGTIHLVDHWGKRKLAYTIKKQRQGYYELFYFELDPNRVSEIDRKLKMSETILRFLMFRMEKIQIQNLKKEIVRRAEAASATPAPEPAAAVVVEAAPETALEAPVETAVEAVPETPSEA